MRNSMAVIETSTGAFGLLGKVAFISIFGLIGAALMAMFDPPKDKKTMFMQAATAITISLLFGPVTVSLADYYFEFITLTTASSVWEVMEIAGPIYALTGAVSWGFVGFLSKLRAILNNDGANIVKTHLEK